jgi:hypothetical protein
VLRRFWHRHSLTIVLATALLTVTAYLLAIGPGYYRTERLDPGETVHWVAYWRWWSFQYALALPANIGVAITLVVLTKKLREAGSPETGESRPNQQREKA